MRCKLAQPKTKSSRFPDMNLSDIREISIADLAEFLQRRTLTSSDLVAFAIEHHEIHGSDLNAYIAWNPLNALEAARQADKKFESGIISGPMQGIPISVKDLYGLPEFPTFAGSSKELPSKWRRTGPIVQTLLRQCGVFMGKTHTVQFAYGGLGVNNHWRTPRNPWDSVNHRVPGGSSSGAGISLTEGSAFLALGTDTSGSVRVPASYTGNVGLKTSSGRWSTKGIVPLSPFLDTAGILTRSVRDAAFAFLAIDIPDIAVNTHRNLLAEIDTMQYQNFRIGLDEGIMWSNSEQSIVDVCMEAIRTLESDGCTIVPIEFPEAERAIEVRNVGGTVSAELIEFLRSELPDWIEELDPVIKKRIEMGGDISAVEFLRRKREIRNAREDALDRFDSCDVIVSPTVPLPPPLLKDVSNADDYMPQNLLALQNTTVGSFLDFCAITIPVGLDSLNLPVGLQLMAPAEEELTLLALGQRLESLVPAPQPPRHPK